ncbi:MAG: sugar transferase [Motiliproteus sp.]|nr:sugar transferase [Motiliproteus sp.]MCW9053469.1 sugar transferase [Motiliproteus sp.]
MKRYFDLALALVLLVLFSPVLVVLFLVIWAKLGWPVFFIQTRPGEGGKPFNMIKFRSMLDSVDHSGELLPDSKRLTGFGRFLRASSLDELPELLNVISGDMSLVGPRPLLMEYLPLYSARQTRRHEVRPGITGWAQINGRNAISWEDRLEMDVWYVDNQSFFLDLKILMLTVFKVIGRKDVSAESHATMPRFKGSNKSKDKP